MVSSFTVHAWPRQHFHPPRSRLPLLTFPVAFFLVAASRGRGDSARAFGWLQKTFSIRFFANCASRSLSLSSYDEYAYVLTARCSYAPRYALRCLWPSFSVVQSAPKSNEYFEKRKKLQRSLDEIYFPLLHILWVIFGWSGLCTYAFPIHSHNDAWSTLTNILKTTQEFSSKVKRIVLRLLCLFLSLS